MKFLNSVVHGDCIDKLAQIPDKSIDLIFADPPYNLQLNNRLNRSNRTRVDAVSDKWDKFDNFSEYDKFTYSWLKECKRVLKKDGTIWVIGSYHNIFRVGKIIQDLDFWILNDVLWIKSNPMPNFMGTRFNNAHETMIWASENENSKYTFNYKSMKVFNDDKQLRSDWYIPVCGGEERIKDKYGKRVHSTQKPYELLYRIIMSSSKVGNTVLDPFFGTGTTGAVAKYLGRNFIGIEKEKKYIKIALKRIAKITPLDKKYLTLKIEDKKVKVPFGNLIESNYIKIGENLYSKNEDIIVIILANATIKFKEEIGSIHTISAKILKRESANGWNYWYVKRDNKLISIDELRQRYIEKNYQKE